jgi:myo-inositol-1(or 4)-monophosphatase
MQLPAYEEGYEMENTAFDRVKEVVLRLMVDANALAMQNYAEIEKFTYKNTRDIVTKADVDVEKYIRERLKENYPEHNIIGEELKKEQNKSDYTWLIDPIDGTTNFAHKIPYFSIALALQHKETVIFSAISHPPSGMLFYAGAGEGAYMGKVRMEQASDKKLKDSFISFCHASDNDSINAIAKLYEGFKLKTLDFRKLGSANLEICYTAAGFISGFIGYKIKPWDFKGACLIAEEAGCKVTGIRGEDWQNPKNDSVIVAPPHLHDAILKEVSEKLQLK